MTQRSGKFTRGRCEAQEGSCMWRGPADARAIRFVPIVSPIRTHDKEACANASMLAAALNAATAAEDMGYDGQAAVEALPKLLDVLETVAPYFEGEHHYDHPDNVKIRAARKALAALDALTPEDVT